MNIPKEAIEKAIEGGWKKFGDLKNTALAAHNILAVSLPETIALDPTFWQALGKNLAWNNDDWETCRQGCQWWFKGEGCSHDLRPRQRMPFWRFNALRFYGLILQGQSTDDFWNELLTGR
jgi:hypothetical protein